MRMIKIAFFDIDGTIISINTHRMQESTKKALDELRKNGVVLCIATGRGKENILPELVDYFDIIIALNGQYIYDKNRVIAAYPVSYADRQTLIDLALECKYELTFNSDIGYFSNFHGETLVADAKMHAFPPPEVIDPEKLRNVEIYGGSVYIPEEEEAQLLSKCENLDITRWRPQAVDYICKNRGKGEALERCCDYFGIDPEHSIAFGDGGNDVDMIKAAGIGVAMGNAFENVKAAADYITTDQDHDGVYNALKDLNIISGVSESDRSGLRSVRNEN